MMRRLSRNPMANERFLKRFSQRFQLVHNSRLAGSTQRQQRICFITGRRLRSFDGNYTRTGGPPDIFDDILCGDTYLDLTEDNTICEYDTILMLLINGTQLYEHKESNCWIYIWLLVDLAPDKHYKIRNVFPGGIIPGPKSPKNIDSFLFPGLAHVSALQHEGLHVWDAYHRCRALSYLFLFLVWADAMVIVQLSRSVGHHGQKGCRLLCGLIG